MIGTTVGGFTITRELGRGGMGVVYEAMQDNPRRPVALKVLPPHLAQEPGVVQRFQREAQRMAALAQHPSIATVDVAGQDGDLPYMAMQLLTGGTLDDLLTKEPVLDPRRAAQLIIPVAEALDYAHRQGIVHRDVKPGNILLSEMGLPVVTDFGIAQAADEIRITSTGMSVGTPEYASPEQIKGNPVDGRSDLYSLGLVLYRMVCGREPFAGETPMSRAMQRLTTSPVPPRQYCPALPPALEAIILRCLALEPSQRFASAGEVAAALRAFLAGQPLNIPVPLPVAPPPPVPVPQRTIIAPPPPPPPPPRSSNVVIPLVILCAILGIGLVLTAGILLGQGHGPATPPIAQPPGQEGAPTAPPGTAPPVVDPNSTAPPPGPTPEEEAAAVEAVVERWRAAWESNDADTQAACLWSDGVVDRMSRERYRAWNVKENRRQPNKEVELSNLRTHVDGSKATVQFVQYYHGWGPASNYESSANVTHTYTKRNGEWRLYRENFQKIWSKTHR
ncbi:MAG: protein kinase [Armatimonadia bacterium]